ncbi:MAG: 6,7-dimethyl-8-ribityllumazine synthase [Candidatus Eisenbacteria bacterium]|nr:6,7-dimethyl-8-ribityllumazine synthase [Candidatus Eisenbacteria bacterium]
MPQELSGALDASGRSFGIVVARFNEFFTRRLMEGAVDALLRHGADEEGLAIVWVPGTWEIAPAVRVMALSGRFDAVIGLGLVIKGETNHHELVAGEAVSGLAEAQRVSGVPCPLGIVSAENLDQATERCGSKQGNRGWDAAMAAMEMANLLPALAAGPVSGDGSTVLSEADATPVPRAKGSRPSQGLKARRKPTR